MGVKLTFQPFSVVVRLEVLQEEQRVGVNSLVAIRHLSCRSGLGLLDDDFLPGAQACLDAFTPKLATSFLFGRDSRGFR